MKKIKFCKSEDKIMIKKHDFKIITLVAILSYFSLTIGNAEVIEQINKNQKIIKQKLIFDISNLTVDSINFETLEIKEWSKILGKGSFVKEGLFKGKVSNIQLNRCISIFFKRTNISTVYIQPNNCFKVELVSNRKNFAYTRKGVTSILNDKTASVFKSNSGTIFSEFKTKLNERIRIEFNFQNNYLEQVKINFKSLDFISKGDKS